MALGIDLMNFTLRVYGILPVSAAGPLKVLLEKIASFFNRGPCLLHRPRPSRRSRP
jgi:hypothetical protein